MEIKMLNRLKVIICGKEYMLQTEEAPSYVYGLAKLLEKKINDISSGNNSISPYSAAIMVALSTLDDLSKAQANVDSIRAQAKEYVDEAGKARIESTHCQELSLNRDNQPIRGRQCVKREQRQRGGGQSIRI